jgi:enediyne polyketide synthase
VAERARPAPGVPPPARSPAGRRLPRRPEHPDLTYLTHAAVLRDWEFDRERFGIPASAYRAADHTHWLALETAAGALADAGFPEGSGLDRDGVGVVLGNSLAGEFTRAGYLRLRWPFLADAAAGALAAAGVPAERAAAALSELEQRVKRPFPEPGDETLAGSLANTIARRICNHFDFHGTGYTVDGACSSSLLAIMTACRDLASGAHDFMLAGGVDLSLDPLELVGFARLGALAGATMRVYDAEPTGFLPGEGCGVVALMRAGDADRLGLRTYAHIVGWASSSDGAGGLTRPDRDGQVRALRRAYRLAGVAPGNVRLIEGHGTGTAVGDSVELAALAAVRSGAAAAAALGTVKANIGHTKAAAGAAGLIKVEAVEANTDQKWVVLYVRRWLAAPLQLPDGTLVERDRGTPQGSSVSPVLANLFMHYAFDLFLVREFPAVQFERYCDDGVPRTLREVPV